MNEMNYEFTTMVNRNHQKAKAQEFNIPEYEYTDHEIRMEQLRRKADADRQKVNREAIKFGLMMAFAIPTFYFGLRLMIAVCWAYSYAVRGF